MMTVQADAGRAREVALAAVEAVRRRDLDQIVALGHRDEYVDDFVAIGEFRGQEAVRGFFGELFAAMPDFDLTVDRVVADERTVSVKWQARATFTGAPFQGIEPTGRAVQLRGVDFFEIEDGLIRRNTVFYDGASFARQIGMLPREGSPMDRAMIALFNLKTRLVRRARHSPAQARNYGRRDGRRGGPRGGPQPGKVERRATCDRVQAVVLAYETGLVRPAREHGRRLSGPRASRA